MPAVGLCVPRGRPGCVCARGCSAYPLPAASFASRGRLTRVATLCHSSELLSLRLQRSSIATMDGP